MFIWGSYSLMLSFCGGWVGGAVCTVIFLSNPTAVLRLRLCCVVVWGCDNRFPPILQYQFCNTDSTIQIPITCRIIKIPQSTCTKRKQGALLVAASFPKGFWNFHKMISIKFVEISLDALGEITTANNSKMGETR